MKTGKRSTRKTQTQRARHNLRRRERAMLKRVRDARVGLDPHTVTKPEKVNRAIRIEADGYRQALQLIASETKKSRSKDARLAHDIATEALGG